MDIIRTTKEIGFFETATNLNKVRDSDDVIAKAGAFMPLPDADIEDRTAMIADWLLSFGKQKYLFFTPEIALIQAMARRTDEDTEAIIAIPCDMEADAEERVRNNLPRAMKVSILKEPFFPEDFFPRNAIQVICGYSAGGRAMVLPETVRLTDHYSNFRGRKAFVPYVVLTTPTRYHGWMETDQQKITVRWNSNYDKLEDDKQ